MAAGGGTSRAERRERRAERERRRAERERRRAADERFQRRVTWASLGLVLAGPVLAIGAGALGAAEVYPYEYAMPVAMWIMGVFTGLGLLVASCAGMYLLGGPRAAPFGAVLVAGVGVLVYGLVRADDAWRDVGVVLLAIGCGSFWAVPALLSRPGAARRRGRRPAGPAGIAGVVVVGAVLAVVGHMSDEWWVLLLGAASVGTAAGGGIAAWAEGRRGAGG
ncbi:hypothetical protein LO763_27255 [Glycomyces sp. A-F 0318]|uniref:hypothetical protein n=1 Tax=Glycomyces amatae TaxID=2881355 RepID=UPI001E4274AC|nr:hypothetical protein [Glycomyces amatae]MCD0447319.1 hypothetical protein [Glycomyces amatae]